MRAGRSRVAASMASSEGRSATRRKPRRWQRPRPWAARYGDDMARLEVVDGDITRLAVDAIANAANTQLLHAGGVAAAIARAGGAAVEKESRRVAPVALGEVGVTSGGDMPCRWVLHAATMELGGPTSAEVIRACTASTLRAADSLGARSLALVAFGTGVGGFPVGRAATIEVEEVRRHLDDGSRLEAVFFAVRGASARRAFEAAIAATGDEHAGP